MKQTPTWIWYYGDFEVRQHLLVDCRRLEENLYRPAPWKLDDCWHNVQFRRKYHLEQPTDFRVTVDGIGSVQINCAETAATGIHYFSAGEWLTAPAGDGELIVEAANLTGLPAIFVEGDVFVSDGSWEAAYDNFHFIPVGLWNFTDRETPPSRFELPCTPLELKPLPCETGLLFDAGRETMCRLKLRTRGEGALRLYYGECLTEALDDQPNMWIRVRAQGEWIEPARAFRYLRIAAEEPVAVEQVEAFYEHLPLEARGTFRCSDEVMNRIWDVSVYTLELNARECFLDGIKRDRYAWSGDAYQSYLLNYYSFFDQDICRRTTLALRGKDPMGRHINTIMDYSFYWVLGLADYVRYTGDLDFIRRVWPKAESLMEFCLSRANEDGLMVGLPEDWVFVDWAPLDKDGPICVEQILLAKSLETMAELGELLGLSNEAYRTRAAELRRRIQELYWDEEQGAFIDSYTSGKKLVTRQTNLFAVRFAVADERQQVLIRKNVLLNDAVTAITTPYFKFYEMESLCAMAQQRQVTEKIKEYWGGMLQLGATSFWEEFDPQKELAEGACTAMYGKRYARSLCHAWGASPLYLLGRFYLGAAPTAAGYSAYTVEPELGGLEWMKGTVPTPRGDIRISVSADRAEVCAPFDGGVLRFGGREIAVKAGVPAVIQL